MNAIGIKNTKSTRVGDDLTAHEGQRKRKKIKDHTQVHYPAMLGKYNIQ